MRVSLRGALVAFISCNQPVKLDVIVGRLRNLVPPEKAARRFEGRAAFEGREHKAYSLDRKVDSGKRTIIVDTLSHLKLGRKLRSTTDGWMLSKRPGR
jgi:hypothetical protein